ncbi:hypothetical protein Bca101_035791 [Brassica carinata]
MYFVSCLKTLIGYYCINPSCILQSESVNGTNAGRKSLAEDKGPDVPADVPAAVPADKEDARYLEKKDDALALCRAKSDRTRKLARSQKSPYTANRTARVIISNTSEMTSLAQRVFSNHPQSQTKVTHQEYERDVVFSS